MARTTGPRSVDHVFPSPEVGSRGPLVATRSAGSARIGLTPRRSTAVAKSEAAKSLQRFVRQEYWNGLAAGDVVRVAGHTARGRHWRFRAHVTNTSNGATWVEVALMDGPPPSKRPLTESLDADGSSASDGGVAMGRVEKVRSFDPSLVTPRWRRKGRVAAFLRPGIQPPVSQEGTADSESMSQPSLF
jgi:hypothetical protein